MDNKNEIISSHIFVFPFRWDYISNGESVYGSIDKRLNVDKVGRILMESNCWEEDKPNIENEEVEYNKYIYFYDNVRDAIYGKGKYRNIKKELYHNFNKRSFLLREIIRKDIRNRVVQCFKYNKLNDKSTYNIKISKKEKIYSLNIKSIKLKIYDTGVAALSFFLENYDQDSTPEDILNINDYGRRIFPQFLPLESVQNSFLAKNITLNLSNNKYSEEFNYDAKVCPNRISNTIMKLLGDKFTYDEENLKKGQVFISPIMDDRMFLLSIYRNNNKSKGLINPMGNSFKKSYEFWYKYIFVDNESLTCQDDEMFKELIKKSTYLRWRNYGTFYGISRYSFVVLKNKNKSKEDVLMNHFYTMYYEMALLVLIQRASILRLSDEASKIAIFDEDEALENVKKLQRYYTEFINDLYFREVTAQEQGIEIYNKLVQMMEIERDVKRLGEEIDGIQKYTSMISSERISTLLRIITYLGLGFTVCSFLIKVFGNDVISFGEWNINDKFSSWLLERVMISVAGIAIIIALFKKVINSYYFKITKRIFWIAFIITFIILMFAKNWV
ncbi:hypothetical protein [Clostridium sp.]|uniref:hypothetical protein n=1 Tax=Clostridium sp. TaxID=1506 RepID=UPI002FDDDF8B